MSTNYYLCKMPAHAEKPLANLIHIGKRSAGWAFGLHVIPELGINNLDNWITEFDRPESLHIVDEYGTILSSKDMLDIITSPQSNWGHPVQHRRAGAFGCVGNGNGPYDYIRGEFR